MVRGVEPFSTHITHKVKHLSFLRFALHFSSQPRNNRNWWRCYVSLIRVYVGIHAALTLDSMVKPVTDEQEMSAACSTLKEPSSVAYKAALLLTHLSLIMCVWTLPR